MLTLQQAKGNFFDRKAVLDAVGQANARNLARTGALIRTIDRRSMRRRRGPSPPGQPPHAHVGLVRDHVYFSFESDGPSVVVGPALLPRMNRNGNGLPVGGATVPEVLEYGGDVSVFQVRTADGWERSYSRRPERIKGRGVRKQVVRVAARPSIRPATEKAMPKLDPIWRDSVRPAR